MEHSPLEFIVQVSNKITILDSGLVGINKTAPAKHLHVGGAIAMDETNGLLFFAKDGEGVNTNTNNTHWIGRVDNAGYHATTGAGGFSSVAGSLAIGAKGPIMFATSANNDTYSSGRMIITADGKLGLGLASPTDRLHIQDSSDTGAIRLGGGNGAGNHRLYFQAHPSTAYIDSYGNNTHKSIINKCRSFNFKWIWFR